MLWQLPPRFHRDDKLLESALEALTPGRHAFEFRDPSWLSEDVYERLRGHRVALVVADRSPGAPSPWVDTAGWSYLRFHSGRARDGNYGGQELRAWATRVTSQTGDLFAYFNNDWQSFAIANARTLRGLVGRTSTPA